MSDIENRLVECFSVVFPNLSREQIAALDRDSAEAWDSIAGITLITILQQELHVDIDLTDLEHLSSFQAVLAYVEARIRSGSTQVDQRAD
jgi:acyl carrier protein